MPSSPFVALALVVAPALAPLAGAAVGTGDQAWQLVSCDSPALVWVGRPTRIDVVLRNAGLATWSPDRLDLLAYHWRAADGSMVIVDGARTPLPHPVGPGETVALAATVVGPPGPGRWRLEWEMLREGVRWYGPPAGGGPAELELRAVVRHQVVLIGLALLTLAGVAVARRLRPSDGSSAWVAIDLVPVAWAGAAGAALGIAFAELAAYGSPEEAHPLIVSSAALLALPVALLPAGGRAVGAGLIATLGGLVVVADLLYLRFFGSIVPLVATAAIGQLGQVGESVTSLLRPGDLAVLWLAGAGAVLALLWPRCPGRTPPLRRQRRVARLAAAGLLAAGALPMVAQVAATVSNPTTGEQQFSERALAARLGLVGVHTFDLVRTAREWLRMGHLGAEERAAMLAFFRRTAESAPQGGVGFGIARGYNLLLVQVESLQEWVVGARAGGRPVMPFLSALRAQSLDFPAVFDQAEQGRTSDGEFAALNSQHPLPSGAVAFRRAHNTFLALPEVLRRHGYTTLSAHAFDRGFWNRGALHPRYGFQRSLFADEIGEGEVVGWGLADAIFVERMLPRVAELPQPFLAFLITLGPHHPFDSFPAHLKELDVGTLEGTPLGNYLHTARYVDRCLAALVAGLEARGRLERTVVAIYGDHESGLAVEEPLLKLLGEEGWDPTLQLRLRRVPLVVYVPGPPAGRGSAVPRSGAIVARVDEVGAHVDIAPTLLYLLGVPRPASFVGTAMAPGRDGFAAFADGSVVAARLMYVAAGPLVAPGGACYGLPDRRPLELARCQGLRSRAQQELAASRAALDHDLVGPILTALATP